jgi:hypothetical protein
MRSKDASRRMREELEELEAARLRLSEDVMKGSAEALEEDRRLELRIREPARRPMGVEGEDGRGGGAS